MFQDINDNKFDPDCSRLLRQRMARAVRHAKEFSFESTSRPQTEGLGRDWEGQSEHESVSAFDQFALEEFSEPNETEADNLKRPSPQSERDDTSDDSDDSSSSSSDDSSEQFLAKDDERSCIELCTLADDRPKPFFDKNGVPLPVMQHVTSGILHCRKSDTHMQCNRIISRAYTVVSSLKLNWPVCSQCRTRVPVVTFIQAASKAPPSVPN